MNVDEFQAEAELRLAIEDAESNLAGLRATLATYPAAGDGITDDTAAVRRFLGIKDPAEEWTELVNLLEWAWVLFGEHDTIEPEHLQADDEFDRWCIAVKEVLGPERLSQLDAAREG